MRASGSTFEGILALTLALGTLPGIGPRTVQKILRDERSLIETAETFDRDFIALLGGGKIGTAIEKSDAAWHDLMDQAYETLDLARQHGILPLHPYMPEYPSRLLANKNFPPLLFCKGDLSALNAEKAVAMIGTRRPTDFGARMGRRLAEVLAQRGYAVVSGLALGCDTAAHEGALAGGGKTVAVLPTPLDAPAYPKENAELAQRILEGGGALVSEYLPGTRPSNRQLVANLVARDEWQPALADGLIVCETSIDGGSRHAFGHARKAGKPVAVFDYREKGGAEFLEDPRFSGNVEWLAMPGVSPLFSRDSIGTFERRMDAWRQDRLAANESTATRDGDEQKGQLAISLDEGAEGSF